MRCLRWFLLPIVLCLAACGDNRNAVDEYNLRPVTLPDGTTVKAEVMMERTDMAKGMMFRDEFPEGRAMLFIHPTPNRYPYWMYQVKIPIDIVWMDLQRKVVEIVESAPPCMPESRDSRQCPNYGGTKEASYVLELPSGYARKHGIREGAVVQF